MFNPYIKFEVSTITCNKQMKNNAKCKNSRFEPPFGKRTTLSGVEYTSVTSINHSRQCCNLLIL